MCAALWAAVGIICFASAPAMAWDQNPQSRDMGCSPTVANPCTGGSTGSGSSGGHSYQRDDSAEQARFDKANKLFRAAKAAASAGDAREALRLAREAQAMADDYTWLKDWVRQIEDYIAQEGARQRAVAARKAADAAREEANAAYDSGDWRAALVLYQRALATDAGSLSDYGKQRVKDLDVRLKSETEAAERESRHRPEVDRLRTEAKTLIDEHPADALAKLNAALKLLPGDSKTTGNWWLAQASLALHEARYDAAFEALKKTEEYGLEAAEVAKWNSRVKEERERQGENVQSAFGDLRKRLEATPGGTDPGEQLKSVERHSRDALDQASRGKETARDTARMGFDIPGKANDNLVYPDKKQRQIPPSALDKHIPPSAQKDPEIQKLLAWSRSLEAQKAETAQKIAAIKEEQKNGTGDVVVLAAQLGTFENRNKQIDNDQIKATKSVKKQLKNLSLAWIESAPPDTSKTPADKGLNSPPTESQSQPSLDFIK